MTDIEVIRAKHRDVIALKRQEIRILQDEIIQLSQKYNTLSLIAALPSEVLFLIFQAYLHHAPVDDPGTEEADEDLGSEDENEDEDEDVDVDKNMDEDVKRPPHWRWLVLSQVCHTWRTIVLSNRLLWSQLDSAITQHPCLVEKYLMMSCGAPLDVFMKRHSFSGIKQLESFGNVFNRILEEEPRLRSLDLEFHRAIFQYNFRVVITEVSLMYLESLEIRISERGAKDGISPLFGISAILESNLQSLRHIVLNDVYPEWSLLLNLPPTVVELSILNDYQPRLDDTMEDVLAVLKKLIHLKRLTLYCCLPPAAPDCMDLVNMPELEELTILGECNRGVSIFRSLALPHDTMVHIELDVRRGLDILTVCSSVFAHMHRLYGDHRGSTRAVICVDNDLVTLTLFKNTVNQFHLALVSPEEDVTLPIEPTTILRNVIGAITPRALSSITALSISMENCHAPNIPDTLSFVFPLTDRLETLTVTEWAAAFPSVLRPGQDLSIPLPHLQYLYLGKVKIVDRSEDHVVGSLDIATLCECLEKRRDCGSRLATLQIERDCIMHVSDLDGFGRRLRGAVEQLEGWEE